jgi:hypothetical protein
MTDRKTNMDVITEIMEYSPYGALSQMFVIDALLKQGLLPVPFPLAYLPVPGGTLSEIALCHPPGLWYDNRLAKGVIWAELLRQRR